MLYNEVNQFTWEVILMKLENTKNLVENLKADKRFDSYGIFVCDGENKTFLHSDNVNSNTYFDIASMGKILVTATLLLKAVGKKELSVDNTLDELFKNVPNEKKKITIKQLLTHTSGIVRYPIPRGIADLGSEKIAEHILSYPLAYTPGEGKIYSCNAYILLGFIVEKIYNLPLDKAFYQYTKSELGLTKSRFNIAIDEKNAALCYSRRDVGEYRSDDENVYSMRGIAGNGAQFWTMSDIEKFCDAVMEKSEKLYPKEIYDLAEQSHTGNLGEDASGLGWLIVDERYKQTGKLFPNGSFGHCGHTGCSFFFNRKENMYVIILTNATRGLWLKNNCTGCDYGVICKMREELHNAIATDLNFQF